MDRRTFLRYTGMGAATALMGGCATTHVRSKNATAPNIVYILADDMGIGDVGCYNPDGKISTPNMDRIAAKGMRFDDMHTGSAVCTPTRYGLLTGRYCWRSKLQDGVTWGYSPALVDPERMTVASLLKKAGYHTACVGKWHLGLNWATMDGKEAKEGGVDYSKPFTGGPCDLGFDEFFGIPASLDMDPYVYCVNDRVEEAPTSRIAKRTGPAFLREGPCPPGFKPEEVLPRLTERSVAIVEEHAKDRGDQPLFLYFPLPAPHSPIAPTKQFEGKSDLSEYGDFVMQVDDTIGQVLQALDRNGMAENTLFIVTSDNGCSPIIEWDKHIKQGHHPSREYRGHKADIFEGGHRVPFIAHWPERIKSGTSSAQTLCLTDLMATAAALTQSELPENAGEDSVSFLPTLTGKDTMSLRAAVVHHSINGSFAIREDDWKLEFCPGSGGWSAPKPKQAREKVLPPMQLYNLVDDPGEQQNVYADHPEVVTRLTRLMENYIKRGRSTPGVDQDNDVVVTLWK